MCSSTSTIPFSRTNLFILGKEEANGVFATLRKLKRLTWSEVHKDKGLRWELVQSKRGPGGTRLYTIRITDKIRALVYRDAQFMRFLLLHLDNDFA